MKFLLVLFVIFGLASANQFNHTLQRKGLFSTTTTTFTFTATIQCHIMREWCVQLQYFEHDTATSNDAISASEWYCNTGAIQIIETKGTMDGDGPLDWYYEPFVDVSHSCRHDGSVVTFRKWLPPVSVDLESAPVPYSLSLLR